jgi:A/G-specific adenine glycosylase
MPHKVFINNDISDFSFVITKWFEQNCRNLPWRHTRDPYLIWISEIVLQQTRVNQGLEYFNRFVARFPTIQSLAEADEDEVMKYWQGLGYYSRARNLHTAACQIQQTYNGVFPSDYESVIKLKGIGEYTAAAICSFAYDQPYAVLDGNVFRVLSRVFDIETPINTPKAKKEFLLMAQSLLNEKNPAAHNQAIMEFGALQCVPSSPNCAECPLIIECVAYKTKKVNQLPIKIKKSTVKERYFNYFFIQYKGFTYIKKRIGNDIWKNLYEFPLIETAVMQAVEDLIETESFKNMFLGVKNIQIETISAPIKHVLTHRIINAVFYTIKIDNENDFLKEFVKIELSNLHTYPVSRLIEIFIEKEIGTSL